ncbi:MAG: tetratricopeptide repeat protein, partial [Candidatus Omnitrophica bacterium]|nr:tetratricopeptide repeat protein [Candidatus Omnitrophota bacterium]
RTLIGSLAQVFAVISLTLFAQAAIAENDLSEWQAAYLRGEYAKVIESAQEPSLQDQTSRDYFLYWAGMSNLQIQQYTEAQEAFQKIVSEYAQSRWRPAAQVGIADAVWLSGRPAEAVPLYQQILSEQGTDPAIALRASYQLAQAARAAGQWETARAALKSVSKRFPTSFESRMAQQILSGSDFAFSVQVGAFGMRDNAMRLQRQLARLGYSASVDQATAEGRAMHRVRVGRFQNREEAARTAQQLKQEGFPAKVVP